MKQDIHYYAYKNLLLNLAKNSFHNFKRLLTDLDYYSFKETPELLLGVLDIMNIECPHVDKSDILIQFYNINPEEKKNIILAKKILEKLISESEIEKIFNLLGEDNFIKDFEFINKIVENTEGRFFTRKISEKASKDKDLRSFLYKNNKFSLLWFQLEPPEEKDLIVSILKKDFHSYRALKESQREDKDITITALNTLLEKKNNDSYRLVKTQIYDYIPKKLKDDKEVCLLLSNIGYFEQEVKAYMFDEVLSTLLNVTYKNSTNTNLYKLEYLPKEAFKNYKNVKVFLDFIKENQNKIIKDHNNYSFVYKVIKGMVKHNKYVKELFSKENSSWNNGNITETKYNSSSFFNTFFNEKIKEMSEQISYYIAAEDMKKILQVKEEIKKVNKIKI